MSPPDPNAVNQPTVLIRMVEMTTVDPSYWGWLDPAEHQRAQAYHSQRDADSFVIVRAELRRWLGQLLGIEAPAVSFETGPHGKPRLAAAIASSGWRFNVSHSAGLALIAMSRDGEVGIDVEKVTELAEAEMASLAGRHFAPGERARWERGGAAGRTSGFFRIWTAKEAVLKARGDGLNDHLDLIDTTETPLVSGTWKVMEIPVADGFAAAVAAAGAAWQPRMIG